MSFRLARRALHRERRGVEGGPQRPEGKPLHDRRRKLASDQVEQKGSKQWTMDNQPWIALPARGVAAIVVNAMAIERQRGVSEQKHVVGHDLPAPLAHWRSLIDRKGGLLV